MEIKISKDPITVSLFSGFISLIFVLIILSIVKPKMVKKNKKIDLFRLFIISIFLGTATALGVFIMFAPKTQPVVEPIVLAKKSAIY